ncbi:MAG: PhnD/SsuA/transferrin family substrate-binding protein [Nitrospirae bacterium]|nr:PhnD/SsuA/transferrin family substrate-binding protein [Nitrospirota bacterium]NTW66280.1 PhnD/SsuA/transferrin family substrate-binding protein [Nitrospirota bacterium]
MLLLSRPAGAENKQSLPSPYTVAVIPFYGPEKIWLLYSPLIEYLKKTTGHPWELKLYPNHDALIEDLCGGQIGVALLGPAPLGRANRKCGAEPLIVALGKDGKPTYRSVIVTSDAAVTALGGVRGKKFGFFKGSTAAHIVPAKLLKDAGLGMEAVQPVFLESQDRIMTALLTREISAAGVKETLYRKFEKETLRVLTISGPLPNFAFSALPSLPSGVREEFVQALLRLKPHTNIRDADTMQDWDDEIKNGFVTPTDDYLLAVQNLLTTTREIMHEVR